MSKARISRKHRKLMELELKPVLEARDKRIAELEKAAGHFDSRLRDAQHAAGAAWNEVRAFLDKARAVQMRGEWAPDVNQRRGERYRLVLEINQYMIERYFEWGNDAHVIKMLGEQLGHQAAREIAQMNMRRVG